ncbi:MAG: Jag N-terminal domain-containing protein [Candidatus Omnitrophota bacterium]
MTENQNIENEPVWDKEFEGNSIEDAIEKALKELSMPKEKIKIQVLTEGQKGLFGMQGAKKAKIKVSILKKDLQSLKTKKAKD